MTVSLRAGIRLAVASVASSAQNGMLALKNALERSCISIGSPQDCRLFLSSRGMRTGLRLACWISQREGEDILQSL